MLNNYYPSFGNSSVKISILCLTYNHEKYIRDTLDGFLKQKADFGFEIIVHDDASTDKTADIIREYQAKHPTIFKSLIQTSNQYTKVGFGGIFRQMENIAVGQYYAFCEGDDYWIDPYKLQKQVDLLEKENATLVFTNIDYKYETTNYTVKRFLNTGGRHASKDFSDHLFNTNFIAPCTWVFRRGILYTGDYPYKDASFVMALEAYASGKVCFLDVVTSVYRCLDESASHSRSLIQRYSHLKGVINTKKIFIKKYPNLINQQDINSFFEKWYGRAYLMFYVNDKEEFHKAKEYFWREKNYAKFLFYSLPHPILKMVIKFRYKKFLNT